MEIRKFETVIRPGLKMWGIVSPRTGTEIQVEESDVALFFPAVFNYGDEGRSFTARLTSDDLKKLYDLATAGLQDREAELSMKLKNLKGQMS